MLGSSAPGASTAGSPGLTGGASMASIGTQKMPLPGDSMQMNSIEDGKSEKKDAKETVIAVAPAKKVYDPGELENDPELLEYGKWMDLQKKARQPPVQSETQALGRIAQLCMIPVMHGGPDPPIRAYDYDPRIHAAPPKQENPWELSSQLHITQEMEAILSARGENTFLKERKNVISVLGAPSCGKSVLLKLLFSCNPARRDGEEPCRIANQYYPARQVEMKKFKVRKYFHSNTGRKGSRSPSPSAKGSKDESGKAAYDIEDKFFFQRRDFNRFKEANGEDSALNMRPTEGIELHHWKAHEVVILDTAGMNFFEETQKDLEEMEKITTANPHADPGKDRATRKRKRKRLRDPDEKSDIWDSSYRNFLPPLLYGMSGILLLCVPYECDYVEYVENCLKAIIAKVRNSPRPGLIIVRIRKKRSEDDKRDEAEEEAEVKRKKEAAERKKARRAERERLKAEKDRLKASASGLLGGSSMLLQTVGSSSILQGAVTQSNSSQAQDGTFAEMEANTSKVNNNSTRAGAQATGSSINKAPALVPEPNKGKAKASDEAGSASGSDNPQEGVAETSQGGETKDPTTTTTSQKNPSEQPSTASAAVAVGQPKQEGATRAKINTDVPEVVEEENAVGDVMNVTIKAAGAVLSGGENDPDDDRRELRKLQRELSRGGPANRSLFFSDSDEEVQNKSAHDSRITRGRGSEEEEEEDDDMFSSRRGKSSVMRKLFGDGDGEEHDDETDDDALFSAPEKRSDEETGLHENTQNSVVSSLFADDFLQPHELDKLLGEKAELKPIADEKLDFQSTDVPPELVKYRLYFHSIKVFTFDSYPKLTFDRSRRFIKTLQVMRRYIFDLMDDMNELKQGPAGRHTVQQDAEYSICLPVWHGLSNYHMLYLLKVLIAWSNLRFPLSMALGAAYISAHIPNVPNLRLVNFQCMRALVADLLAPVSGRAQDSLSLRWTAAISSIARYVVKMGNTLRDQDYWLLQNELMQWLPCAATAKNPLTGDTVTCSQPRALHGMVHRCDKTGCVWEGEYVTPKWTFNPIEQAVELLAAYESVVRAPEKLSQTEANLPPHERPDKKDEAFFERTANTGGFDLFSDRVSDKYGPPFCALCFRVLMRPEEDLRELNRDRNKEQLLATALHRKAEIQAEEERQRKEAEERKRMAKEARDRVRKKALGAADGATGIMNLTQYMMKIGADGKAAKEAAQRQAALDRINKKKKKPAAGSGPEGSAADTSSPGGMGKGIPAVTSPNRNSSPDAASGTAASPEGGNREGSVSRPATDVAGGNDEQVGETPSVGLFGKSAVGRARAVGDSAAKAFKKMASGFGSAIGGSGGRTGSAGSGGSEAMSPEMLKYQEGLRARASARQARRKQDLQKMYPELDCFGERAAQEALEAVVSEESEEEVVAPRKYAFMTRNASFSPPKKTSTRKRGVHDNVGGEPCSSGAKTHATGSLSASKTKIKFKTPSKTSLVSAGAADQPTISLTAPGAQQRKDGREIGSPQGGSVAESNFPLSRSSSKMDEQMVNGTQKPQQLSAIKPARQSGASSPSLFGGSPEEGLGGPQLPLAAADLSAELPDIGAAFSQHKWYLSKQGNARAEKRAAEARVEMDYHLGEIYDKNGYAQDLKTLTEADDKLSPKVYSSGLSQVYLSHENVRRQNFDAKLTSFNKEVYLKEHSKPVAERFAEIAHRAPPMRDNRGALVIPPVVAEDSLESAILAGVDVEGINRELYMKDSRNGFNRDQLEWIEQTFRNTSSRYIRFCPDCFGGYKRHYRQRGVPDPNKYEENYQAPEEEPILFEPIPFRNTRGHFARHPYTGEFEAYCEPCPVKNIPGKRENYPLTRPYLFERKGSIQDIVIPGGRREPFRVTMYQPLAIPPIVIEQNRKCCPLCGKKNENFALVQPCFHRFCLECILDWTDFCHDFSEVLANYPLGMPAGTFMGRIADVTKQYHYENGVDPKRKAQGVVQEAAASVSRRNTQSMSRQQTTANLPNSGRPLSQDSKNSATGKKSTSREGRPSSRGQVSAGGAPSQTSEAVPLLVEGNHEAPGDLICEEVYDLREGRHKSPPARGREKNGASSPGSVSPRNGSSSRKPKRKRSMTRNKEDDPQRDVRELTPESYAELLAYKMPAPKKKKSRPPPIYSVTNRENEDGFVPTGRPNAAKLGVTGNDLKPKKWCPVCREHIQRVVILDALYVSIGDGIVDIEDWARGQGFTPFPAQQQEAPALKMHINYPTFDNDAKKAQWYFLQHAKGYRAMRKLKIKSKMKKADPNAAAGSMMNDDFGDED
ncbi:unnamed protein product [Amoebophrya sp. A25]|nr:unnamed protein product [Amoebophrya sp. A25]|eukprot:GSA25T00004420001.1